ncbi:ESC reductase [Mollisia scopiformis]|uniref:ESC reductase n=1 Tax=Mollisia scopiformis TaxID=149040 RepID=A0A194WTG5_MOLSC|nr:ESC reductase [Mollisia scopiformis]KUJ11245.1 ESC reductase [Mollisia scopiformis]
MAAQASLTSRLDGKVALITGSSRGMGRQHALEFASRGADIVINYSSSPAPAEATVKKLTDMGRQAIAIKADMSKPAEIAELFAKAYEHFKHIDIVVSNSGVESFGHISEIKPEEIDRVLSINTKGQLLVAQQAYKYLTPGGRLVMLSSISAQAKGIKNHSLYSGSKGAIEAFVRCLALDFGDKKITVIALAPGGVKTDMYVEAARLYVPGSEDWSDEKLEQTLAEWTPLGRVGVPEDISRVCAIAGGANA